MISNVKDFLELALDYVADHMGKSMAALTMDAVRQALKRRYIAKLSMNSWREYANLVLDRIKYVGDGIIKELNKDRIKLGMMDMADQGSLIRYFWFMRYTKPGGQSSMGMTRHVWTINRGIAYHP